MENKINYSRQMQKIIEQIGTQGGRAPRLLLHSCCAPCSSHCMEYLREHFLLTVFYYNPNITVTEEYRKRLAEEKRLIAAYNRQVEEQDFAGMHSSAKANPIPAAIPNRISSAILPPFPLLFRVTIETIPAASIKTATMTPAEPLMSPLSSIALTIPAAHD